MNILTSGHLACKCNVWSRNARKLLEFASDVLETMFWYLYNDIKLLVLSDCILQRK